MNKKILFLLILIIMPLFVDAKTYTFNNGIQEGNGYINMSRFGDRNKYLLLYGNTKFIVNNNGTLAYEERFYNGGFLNYREFCLSTGNSNCSGKSYLVIPSPYWTCSGNSTNKYYINNVSGIDSKSDTNYYSIRVTEFVKPETTVSGIGTYTNPWYFYGNNYVSLSTNSKKYAYFNETNTNKIEKYADTSSCLNGSGSCVNFKMTVAHGYENNTNDGCGLKLYNRDKRMHHYEISNITSDIECVAIFVKKEFNISFDCNGGTGSIPSIKVIYNDNLVIPNQMCSKTGYTQNGWLTGTNENWTSGSTIKFQFDDGEQGINEKKLNLKAKWVANTYYVNYNGNGATGGSTGKTTHTYDTASNLRANGFTRRGYIFAGWATSASGGVVYGNNASIFNLTATPNETINLYAKWTPITYTITYNGNGATGGSTANTGHTYDVAANLRENGFSRTGHTFAGWATSSGGGVTYSNSQSVSNLTDVNGATVTLYAKWTANTYYINYNANGGWNAPGTTTYTYDAGSNTNLSSGVPSKDYYTFIGWSQNSNASSPSYSAGQAWWRGNASNYTLYAVWRKNRIITRYDMNGGYWAGSSEPALGTSGSLITYNGDVNAWIYDYDNNGILNLCNWNNEGYINIKRNDYHAVDGKQWCTGSNGGGTCYNHSTDYNFHNSFANVCDAKYGDCIMTLYVHWEKDSGGGGDGYWCPWCGSSCFTAGTKVSTPKGLENIENLRPGDYVYSYNEKTGTYEIDKVEKNYQRLTNEKIYTVYIESDRIKVTPEHPFYVKGKGWVKVKDLKQGDILINNFGKEMPIVKIDISKYNYGSVVYNLMTQKNHTYFAGFDSILVHNKGGCFLAGTKVITKDGYKDIDKIEVGDIVLSYNEITKKNEYNEVTKKFVHDPKDIDDKLYTLTFDDSSIVKATSPHRFYIRRNNKNMWIAAEELKINDEVLYVDGKYHKILKIICSELKNKVYNFEVKNNHNYYVGKQGILVHNDKYMH